MIIVVWSISAFISIPPLLGYRQDLDLEWFWSIYNQQKAMNVTSEEFGLYLAKEMSLEDFNNFTNTLESVLYPKCVVRDGFFHT